MTFALNPLKMLNDSIQLNYLIIIIMNQQVE